MKILIIDDEPLVRLSLARVFSRKNHEVIQADNGEDGVKKWRATQPDLILLDVLMPGLSGPQVLEEMGADRSGYVVMMSAYSGDHNMESAKKIGANDFISKPFDDIFVLADTLEGQANGGK